MVSMMKAPSKSPGACFERIMLGKQPRHPKWRRQNQVSKYWMIMKIRLEATGIRASQPSKAFCQDARIQVFTGRFVITPVPTIALTSCEQLVRKQQPGSTTIKPSGHVERPCSFTVQLRMRDVVAIDLAAR